MDADAEIRGFLTLSAARIAAEDGGLPGLLPRFR
jgi:hypothetical protein